MVYGDREGPNLLFSTGLFGTMPDYLYGDLLKELQKNMTILTINGPIFSKDVVDLTNLLKVDDISYLAHSSFDYDILECGVIKNAVLVDPICIPKITMNPFLKVEMASVALDYPCSVIKSEKLYKSSLDLPSWQELDIDGDVTYEMYCDVGHPDILDDFWANLAKITNLWGTADWNFGTAENAFQIRKEYRSYIVQMCKTRLLKQ